MKAQKILFCTSSYKTGGGGIASYAHDFIEQFSRKYDIVVITNDDNTNDDNIRFYNIKMNDFSLSNAHKLLNIINEESPNIIVNSNFHLISIITPFIPNNITLISISHFVNDKLAWFAGFNSRYIDSIISLSTYGKQYLQKRFNVKEPDKIQIIYNYISPISSPELHNKKNREAIKIVYPGGCSFYKSAEIVCKAILKLLQTDLNFELYWLGKIKIPGGNWKFIHTKSIQNILSLDKRIKQLGPVSREKAQKILQDTNIFLLPSRGEGFPISLLEAMRGGCISIISNAKHGSLDIIKNNVNGIIIPQNSSQAIIDTISNIITNHNQYYDFYEKSIETINTQLESTLWNQRMNTVLQKRNNHLTRTTITPLRFYLSTLKAKLYIWYDFVRDRIRQLYHFAYFRYLYYYYKRKV